MTTASERVRVVPLGGLGEIGMNCMALEQDEGIIVVDCGITFPDDDVGIDTYHPDLSYLEARHGRIAG
ncbi:MAG TPA: ribonuclease J, partial [Polyangiaceae bacterium]|nr:ribonuclease J [Polyangiaceae bacterium]